MKAKAGHPGQTPVIRYATGDTPIGKIFVAISVHGLCSLQLIGSQTMEAALKECQNEFPDAEFRHDPKANAPALKQVNALLTGEGTTDELTVDMRGTPFQKKVWTAMRKIPPGETCSYGDLAKRVGHPRAVRAVGSACARNRVAIVVPCHRVLRTGGGLGGYGGGLSYKKKLLQIEHELFAV